MDLDCLGAVVMTAGAIFQVVTNLKEPSSARSKTVMVEFRAGGNALHADVSWTAPDGTRTYTGELPLMNTKGPQEMAYEMPAGSPVRITVTNKGSQGGTNLGFAGSVACSIRVDGIPVASENAKGLDSSVTCTADADHTNRQPLSAFAHFASACFGNSEHHLKRPRKAKWPPFGSHVITLVSKAVDLSSGYHMR
jgi:hypothetical protein